MNYRVLLELISNPTSLSSLEQNRSFEDEKSFFFLVNLVSLVFIHLLADDFAFLPDEFLDIFRSYRLAVMFSCNQLFGFL